MCFASELYITIQFNLIITLYKFFKLIMYYPIIIGLTLAWIPEVISIFNL